MKRVLAAATLLVLVACTSPRPAPRVASIAVVDGVLTFDGPIVGDSYERVLAAAGTQFIHTLTIRSGGGSVTEAIAIARWVHAHAIDVVIDGPCFSSCANYIFPAGREKRIVGGGILGWHGSFAHRLYQHRIGEDVLGQDDLALVEATAAKERAFYDELGINGYLAWFGKIAPYRVHNMYFLSQEDMAYFGLTRLQVRADYLSSDLARWNARDKNTLQLITVQRARTNATDPNWPAAVQRTPAP